MAQLAETDSIYPVVITSIIALTFKKWDLYAFSCARIIKALPLLKPVLVIISMIFIIRGILRIPLVIYLDHPYLNELEGKMIFMIIISIISLTIGLLYLKGSLHLFSFKGIKNK